MLTASSNAQHACVSEQLRDLKGASGRYRMPARPPFACAPPAGFCAIIAAYWATTSGLTCGQGGPAAHSQQVMFPAPLAAVLQRVLQWLQPGLQGQPMSH